MTEDQVRRFFNRTATHESGMRRNGDVPEIHRFRSMLTPGKVLDVGCGCGWDAEYFGEYVGLDVSEEMLKSAQGFNPGKVFIQGKATKLPFADKTFSGAMACQSLPMMSYKDIAVASKEVFRVLRPGGHFLAIITEGKGTHCHGVGKDGTPVYVSRYSVESAIQMFSEVGFICLAGSRYLEVSVLCLFLQKPV